MAVQVDNEEEEEEAFDDSEEEMVYLARPSQVASSSQARESPRGAAATPEKIGSASCMPAAEFALPRNKLAEDYLRVGKALV